MIPSGFAELEATLSLLLLAMIRPSAAFVAAPFFNAAQIPMQLRILLAVAIGVAMLPMLRDTVPPAGLLSAPGALLIVSEVLWGLAMGFALQIAAAAALFAGELISSAMGLSFAASIDPASGQGSPTLSTFMSILATLLFLATDGHLTFIATIQLSYQSMPPGQAWIGFEQIWGLVVFGGFIFAQGFLIALPVVASMMLVQLSMGILTRSAPQLNIFSVNLPLGMLVGTVLMIIFLPAMSDALLAAARTGLEQSGLIALGHGG